METVTRTRVTVLHKMVAYLRGHYGEKIYRTNRGWSCAPRGAEEEELEDFFSKLPEITSVSQLPKKDQRFAYLTEVCY